MGVKAKERKKCMDKTSNTKTQEKPAKRYRTLIVDPPWQRLQYGNYGAIRHYELMPLDRIKAMPIKDLTEENAHVWLWVTNATLRDGYDVLEAWGFEPRSIFTWVKLRVGLGNYLRNCTEHILLGTRGKAPVLCKNQINYGIFQVQEHSRKPEEVHKIVERVSPGPYAELFARRKYPGWDIWGNEVESDFYVPGYPVPKYSAKATQDIPAKDNPANGESTKEV